MNIILVYSSQTGNTLKVTLAMTEAFQMAGHAVRAIPIKKATAQDVTSADLLGIGTPCYGSRAPSPVKKFIRELPLLNNLPTFIFATSCGAPGRVLYHLTRQLLKRQAKVLGGTLIRGECYHPAPSIIGRNPGRPDAKDLAQAQQFALAAARHIESNNIGPLSISRPDALKPLWGFFDFVSYINSDFMMRIVMPKPKLDTALCNQCGWCVEGCPSNNITMDPYPVLGNKCIRSFSCLSGCPEKAFKANWLLGNFGIQCFYNIAFERWFGDLEPGEPIYDHRRLDEQGE